MYNAKSFVYNDVVRLYIKIVMVQEIGQKIHAVTDIRDIKMIS